jgi:hypothetical protein
LLFHATVAANDGKAAATHIAAAGTAALHVCFLMFIFGLSLLLP